MQIYESESPRSSLSSIPCRPGCVPAVGPSPGLGGARLALSSGDRKSYFGPGSCRRRPGENGGSDPVMFTRARPPLSSTGPFIGSPINPLGLPEVRSAWMPGLAAAPRSAGGHGQQVGQEPGKTGDGEWEPQTHLSFLIFALEKQFLPMPGAERLGKSRGPSCLHPLNPGSMSSSRMASKARREGSGPTQR